MESDQAGKDLHFQPRRFPFAGYSGIEQCI